MQGLEFKIPVISKFGFLHLEMVYVKIGFKELEYDISWKIVTPLF